MKMNKEDAKHLIDSLHNKLTRYNAAQEEMRKIMGYSGESEFGNSVDHLIDQLISTTSLYLGDDCDWLSWFIYDCEFGKRPKHAYVDSEEILVDSVDKLLRVIHE